MNKRYLHSKLAVLFSSALTLSFTCAAEQPQATDLVGKIYGGIHAAHIETDNERLITPDPRSSLDNGDGFGVEIGYRWLPSTEFRLSHTEFSMNSRNAGYPEPDGSATSIDMLYFPTEKNFYLLAGVNRLDIVSSQVSGNFGAGYRHYLSGRTALYFESKAHYQFSGHYDELTGQVGFVYFFGDDDKSQASSSKAVVFDADNDGVSDQDDQCPNTPMIDKVDFTGCTVFIDKEKSIELLVQFDNNQAIIKDLYIKEIEAMARFLTANPSTSITIEGHASSPGSNVHNKKLSQRRADAIVNMLISEHNISADRLTAIGYGEENLLNLADTEAAHSENRRIIAKVKVTEKTAVKR